MKIILVLCALGLCLIQGATAGLAADYALMPYPAHGDKATAAEGEAAVNDMISTGAKAAVMTKTWRDLEPEKENYALAVLLRDMAANAGRGFTLFFGFQPVNTIKRDMPADLADKPWDDPEMLARFKALLAALRSAGMAPPKYFSIGNEADIYFERHPDEIEAFLKFYQKAAIAVRAAFPGASVGITVTYEGLVKSRAKIVRRLLEASDIAIFTYYPVLDLKPQPVENVGENLDAIIAASGSKDIVLQEVGYPSGALIGSSEEKQKLFYKMIIGALRSREQIRLAGITLLHDVTPDSCDALTQYYGFEKTPGALQARFRDFLCTLGLKTYDGKDKPAWDIVSRGLK